MGDELSKQDLFILMDSYKNNIQLNTTILEQQRQILIMNDNFIEKQKDLCDSVDNLVDRLSECSKILIDNHVVLNSSITHMETSIRTTLETMVNKLLIESNTNCAKLTLDHSKLSNKIYIAMGGMVTIILSIIGLMITFLNKFHSLAICSVK